MQQKPETTAIEIRPLANEAERAAYFRLNAQIFRSQEEIEPVAATRQRFITGMPTFDPSQLRGAFLGDQLVGGYVHLKRFLNIEETQILTGCISGVCTEASFRKRGIAAALMIDALDFAQKQEQHLLMLHGIPDFYHRFKYIDVCEDLPEYSFKHELIATQPATSYQVRPLTREDTPAILKLYLEQHGLSPVSFAGSRTPTTQEHLLFNWFEVCEIPSVVAISPANKVEGYLMISRHEQNIYTYEVGASSWPATLALLQYQSSLAENGQFNWPMAPTTPLYYSLADALPLSASTHSFPDSGWMARPISLNQLLKKCQPLLQRRWQFGHLPWAGAFIWQIEEEYWQVELATTGVLSLTSDIERTSANLNLPLAKLSLQAFTQMLFGFRPATYLATQPGNLIEEELLPVFSTLFPVLQAWIAISDFF